MRNYFSYIVQDIKKYWWTLLIVFALVLLRVFSYENCIFKAIFKIPCPGCGITRAYLCLFQGQIKEAFRFHPLFWLIPIMIIFFILRHVKKLQFLYKYHIIWIIFIAIWIICYVIRLITNSFPF